MRLAGATLSEVLQAADGLVWKGAALLAELLLCHLHELPLILDLPLSHLECVISHDAASHRSDLCRILARHHQVLLRLLVLEVRVLQVVQLATLELLNMRRCTFLIRWKLHIIRPVPTLLLNVCDMGAAALG